MDQTQMDAQVIRIVDQNHARKHRQQTEKRTRYLPREGKALIALAAMILFFVIGFILLYHDHAAEAFWFLGASGIAWSVEQHFT